MKKSGSNEREFVVIAVPSVEEARGFMIASGLFESCPDSNNSVIAKETGIQVILIPISGTN